MTVSRAQRRAAREPRAVALFGAHAAAALDLLELTELAWHDCFGEVSPSDELIDDMLLLSDGTLDGLIASTRLAVTDWRDLKVAAAERRDS